MPIRTDWFAKIRQALRDRMWFFNHRARKKRRRRIRRDLEQPPTIIVSNDDFYFLNDDMEDIGGFRYSVPTPEALERIEDEYERDIEADRGSVGGRPR